MPLSTPGTYHNAWHTQGIQWLLNKGVRSGQASDYTGSELEGTFHAERWKEGQTLEVQGVGL